MKAIVAKLLVGSSLCCLALVPPARADVSLDNEEPEIPVVLSAKVLRYHDPFFVPSIINFETQRFNYSLAIQEKNYVQSIIQQDNWKLNNERPTSNIEVVNQQLLSLGKSPYLHQQEQEELILGLHNSFWSTEDKQRYYGLTTVEQWGNTSNQELSLKQLNYLNSAPILPEGGSALTISGGGKQNLIQQTSLLSEFTDFRGGVAFHQGLADDVTVGLGFVYDDLLLSGFSQFTYQPKNFPLRTTLSLMSGKEGLDLYSHLQLKPSKDFVFNFYSDEAEQKFDLNWHLAPGLNLTALGDSQEESLRAGAKFAFKTELLALLAKAELDNNNQIQWQVASRLGPLRFIYATDALKSSSQINYELGNYDNLGFQCSLFFKNRTLETRTGEVSLGIWGLHFNSGEKVNRQHYLWEFDVGYGAGSEGQGAIASVTRAINPNLLLKLSYESVSLASEDTSLKLQLSSM